MTAETPCRTPSARGRVLRATASLVAVAALGLTLVACGDSGDGDGDGASAPQTAANGDVFNAADVDFATRMIPHHAQAVQLVTIAQGRPLDPEVEQLAGSIRDAQVPEVETMTDWLTAWGEEVPETALDHANAGHGSSEMPSMDGMDDMPGMLTTEELEELANASDDDFQDLWLTSMVAHHEGAIEMAAQEQEDGRFPDAVAMAESIVTSQQQEIDEMESLLGS